MSGWKGGRKVWSSYQHKIGSTKIKQKREKENISCIMAHSGAGEWVVDG